MLLVLILTVSKHMMLLRMSKGTVLRRLCAKLIPVGGIEEAEEVILL